jgi:hypothetical protein
MFLGSNFTINGGDACDAYGLEIVGSIGALP